jgi:hypothetical protein
MMAGLWAVIDVIDRPYRKPLVSENTRRKEGDPF